MKKFLDRDNKELKIGDQVFIVRFSCNLDLLKEIEYEIHVFKGMVCGFKSKKIHVSKGVIRDFENEKISIFNNDRQREEFRDSSEIVLDDGVPFDDKKIFPNPSEIKKYSLGLPLGSVQTIGVI
jgi:hypothetical protein